MAVDNVVRKCLYMTVEDDTFICERLVHTVGRSMGFVYVKDGFIGSLDPEWIQGALSVIFGLFHKIGLMTNVGRRSTGRRATYREMLRQWILCPECRAELTTG